MESIEAYLPLGIVENLAMMPYGWLVVPFAIALLMAAAIISSLPGVVTPVSFLSGALLGFSGIVWAAIGAVIGSQLLFWASRYWLRDVMHRRFGKSIARHHHHLATRGPLYIAGLRLGGMPHVLLTASCAATPISGRAFAVASLLGLLPAITLGALAGHAIL